MSNDVNYDNAYLKVEQVNKYYPGVHAVNDVSFQALRGESTAIIGVNGAGKSTMMNILAGEVQSDSGKFYIDNKEVQIRDQKDSHQLKIGFIHQDVVLFNSLTVAENIFVDSLNQFIVKGILNYKKLYTEAEKYLDIVGADINPRQIVSRLKVGEKQMIEIARALSQDAEILMFDEPTSSLTIKETANLFQIIERLKKQNKVILYITHFIDEVKNGCDHVLVMRDGKVVADERVAEFTVKDFVDLLTGESVETVVSEKRNLDNEPIVLSVKNLSRFPKVKDVSFDIKRGEIVGLWGLLGSGRTEIIRALLGLDKPNSSEVLFENGEGKLVKVSNSELLKKVGYVTENRHYDGLFMNWPIWKNITLPNLNYYKNVLNMDENREHEESERLIKDLSIKTVSDRTRVNTLSGGNQQKILMARWLSQTPKVLLLDEPTRGVDVSSKASIHKLIVDFTSSGSAVVLISSETEEIMNLCDRIMVVKNGTIVSEVEKEEFSKKHLFELCV